MVSLFIVLQYLSHLTQTKIMEVQKSDAAKIRFPLKIV